MYPAAKLTYSLTVHEANSQMYLFLGERQYSSLYKIVKEEDEERLRSAVEKCSQMSSDREINECIWLQTPQGEYEKYIATLRKYEGEEFL